MKSIARYVAAAAIPAVLASPLVARDNGTAQTGFANLTASATLAWTPCYENFTCALLEVPLNYADASVGTVNLAVIKKPGDTPDAQEVLVNPGGPGGSSVDMVMLDFESIQAKIGTKYALVGIDPRGVKNSGPQSDCFEGYPLAARNAFLATAFSPADITHEYELKKAHQSVLQYGKWCSQMYSVNGTARYAGTVATAQDMLHYIELRAKDLGKKPEEAKLWYYGISYGSVLGNTFAALFPDRVERMIIDGVLGLQDNFSGNWKGAVADGDDAARFWFRRCFEAGSLCAFNQNATSWQELEQRYLALLNELKENPVGLGDPLSQDYADLVQQGIVITPHVLTWQNVITQFFGTSYLLQPGLYTALAAGLTQLQTKNYTGLQGISLQGQIATFPAAYDDRMARTLVTCLDANRRANYTDFEDYKEFIHDIYNASSYGGLNVATFSGPICSQLDVSPPESQAFDGVPKLNGAKVPILYVSSIADPVTPLPSAKLMHEQFPGSGLLTFNNSGHCAHFQKAACVTKWETQYMLDGTLPPEGTMCEVDESNAFIAAAKAAAAE